MTSLKRIALVNPNTDEETTLAMTQAAQREVAEGFVVVGLTSDVGPKMITNETELLAASEVVMGMTETLRRYDGVIIGGFGDPGVDLLRDLIAAPIVGIGEASLQCAASRERRFAVATTTPGLASSIERRVASLRLTGCFAGVFLTKSGPGQLRSDPQALLEELQQAVIAAIEAGAEAVVIGGGPFVAAAVALSDAFAVEIVQPVPVATALMRSKLMPKVIPGRT